VFGERGYEKINKVKEEMEEKIIDENMRNLSGRKSKKNRYTPI